MNGQPGAGSCGLTGNPALTPMLANQPTTGTANLVNTQNSFDINLFSNPKQYVGPPPPSDHHPRGYGIHAHSGTGLHVQRVFQPKGVGFQSGFVSLRERTHLARSLARRILTFLLTWQSRHRNRHHKLPNRICLLASNFERFGFA